MENIIILLKELFCNKNFIFILKFKKQNKKLNQ